MTTIKLIVTGASAQAEVDGLLTSGMVGIPVTIVCDGAWDGLTKSMVCRAGSIVKTILNVGNTATVAHECMVPNQTLYIGIEGRNADGTLVIPTVWAKCGVISPGANADADPSADPTLPVWAQIQRAVGNLDDLNTEEKDNLVAAVNEAMEKGVGGVDPEAVQQIVETYLAENPPAPGDDGKSAYQYAVEGGYTGTEAEFAAKLAAEYPECIVEATGGKVKEGNLVVWDADRTLVRDGGEAPKKLPNPQALTIIVGNTIVTYDGSEEKSIEIADGSEVAY